MTLQHVDIVFQIIAFVFAISVHESAHAWMANLRGDPRARMLGRITLNPIKHIDPVGTVLLPLVAVLAHVPMLGWAKPTPVDPRNFRNPVLDDILTSVVGPISNFAVVGVIAVLLKMIGIISGLGRSIIHLLPQVYPTNLTIPPAKPTSFLMPLAFFLTDLTITNLVLPVLNLF